MKANDPRKRTDDKRRRVQKRKTDLARVGEEGVLANCTNVIREQGEKIASGDYEWTTGGRTKTWACGKEDRKDKNYIKTNRSTRRRKSGKTQHRQGRKSRIVNGGREVRVSPRTQGSLGAGWRSEKRKKIKTKSEA